MKLYVRGRGCEDYFFATIELLLLAMNCSLLYANESNTFKNVITVTLSSILLIT